MPDEVDDIGESFKEESQEQEKIEINLDNSSLIEYLDKQKNEEQIKKEQEIEEKKQLDEKEKQELEELEQENYEREVQLYEENQEFQENLLKELQEIKQIQFETYLVNNKFNEMKYNEQLSLHNDLYIFFGLFISAFVVLIFSRSWFNNVL